MTVESSKKAKASGLSGAALRALGVAADALLLLLVLFFSALAVIAIAIAAPLTLGVSALAGRLSPRRRRFVQAA